MDAAPSPAAPPPAPVPAPDPSAVSQAWSRPAQLATAFCLGGALVLAAVNGLGYLRQGTRPAELHRGYRIDLNRAGHPELLQLPGVGENLARRIEAHRRQRGGFRSVE